MASARASRSKIGFGGFGQRHQSMVEEIAVVFVAYDPHASTSNRVSASQAPQKLLIRYLKPKSESDL
jgi:hypothetical protein